MKKGNWLIWIKYMLPAILIIGIIIVFPICYTGYISFTNMNIYHWDNYEFVGLSNFARALLKVDSGFICAIGTTIVWTIFNMVVQVVIAYFIALGLNTKGLKLSRLYKTLLMFPWAMPSYVSILMWRVGMYNTEFGFLDKIINAMGFEKINFLSKNIPAFFSCSLLNIWMALPFMIMMMDGALQSVDLSLYESATLDGAGTIAKNIYITIPSIRPMLGPAIIMTTFTTFKQFDIVYLLTMQKGALSGASLQTIITYAHQNAFVSNNYGLSSAVSIIIFVFIIIFSCITNREIRKEAC